MQRIAITGGTGLIGSTLASRLDAAGHQVHVVTRSPKHASDIAWNPRLGEIDLEKLAGCEAVVHLAGESIFGRWTNRKKERIRTSRVQGTQLLCESLARLEPRPAVLVCASAVGYYGDRGDEILTEKSRPGDNFLGQVCQEWEAACEPARAAGIRVVNVRSGPVLSPCGGMLRTMLPLFKFGLGGRVASGRQWISWIGIDDEVDILLAAIEDDSLAGAINATAPHPVTNGEFTRTLGRVLGRPTLLPVPRFGVKLALGSDGADELALVSVRAQPARLLERGHEFRHSDLEAALRELLER